MEFDYFSIGDTPYTELSGDSLINNPLIFKAINTIANDIASHRFTLYTYKFKDGFEYKEQVYNSPYLHCVNRSPYPTMDANTFWFRVVMNYFTYGIALCIKEETRTKVELNLVPYGTFVKVKGGYNIDGGFHADSNLLVIENSAFAGKPIKYGKILKNEIATTNSIMNNIRKYFGRAHGPIVMSFESNTNIPDDKKDALKAKMTAEIKDSGVMVVNKTADIKELTRSMRENDAQALYESAAKQVASIFNMPASYFNIGVITELDRKHYYHNAVKPLINRIEAALNHQLLKDGDFAFESTIDTNKVEDIRKMFGSGGTPSIISINEARAMVGLSRKDGEEYDKISLGGYDKNQNESLKQEQLNKDLEK